ncbi:MAG TPA: helix-turn-helix domain-containing protein [Propionibacteriaceae bacterium]|jgi:predicted DNA-binding transcriptional regulator AlpA
MDESSRVARFQRDRPRHRTPEPGLRTARPTSAPRSDKSEGDHSAGSELLTDAQLAERWQLSRGTLANQRSQGRGPTYLKIAGRVRYRRSDIESYEAASMVPTRQGAAIPTMTPRQEIEALFPANAS